MTNELRLEVLQVLEECTNTIRTHEFILNSETITLTDGTRSEIAVSLRVVVHKLETLRKQVLTNGE